MNIKELLHKYSPILIPVFFVLMGILSVGVLGSTHIIYYDNDLSFHWYRLIELHYDVLHHEIPLFNTHTNLPYGLGTMIFYPYITLLPFTLLTFIIKRPVTLFYIIFGIIVTLRYFVSYFSYKSIDKSNFRGLVFSILYSSSSILFSYMIRSGDMGVLLATLFLPLAFFGMINLLKYGNWIMLSIGLSLVVFSQDMISVMLIGFLVILIILNIQRFFNLKRLLGLIAAVLLSICTTTLFWLPLFNTLRLNKIMIPDKLHPFASGLVNQFGAPTNYVYGLVEVVGIFLIIFIRKFNWFDLQLWFIGILCILININYIGNVFTKVFPIFFKFQSSYHFSILAHLIFSYLVIQYIGGLFSNHRNNYLIAFILIPILLFMQLGNQLNNKYLLNSKKIIRTSHEVPKNSHSIHLLQYNYDNQSFNDVRHSDYDYRYVNKNVLADSKIFNNYHTLILNKHLRFKRFAHFDPIDKGIKIHLNHSVANLVVPITLYNGYDYSFKVNNHNLPKSDIENKYTQHNKLLTIKNIKPGNYVYQIYPKVNQLIQTSYIVTLIGSLISLGLIIFKATKYLLIRKSE